MGDSAIDYVTKSWSPIRGCTPVSAGCAHCWATRDAIRHAGGPKVDGGTVEIREAGVCAGLVRSTPSGPRWTGEVRLTERDLDAPLRWRKPARIAVCFGGDLFHERVPDEWIDAVWGVMASAGRHTFLVLTKRPERMRDYVTGLAKEYDRLGRLWKALLTLAPGCGELRPDMKGPFTKHGCAAPPNVWLGVSVEDQATADARIPRLLATPAAVRWVSYEPALGPVDFEDCSLEHYGDGPPGNDLDRGLDWLVIGGESGPGARPCDVAWIRSVVAQAKEAGVPVFVKQLGARPIFDASDPLNPGLAPPTRLADPPGIPNRWGLKLRDRKGASPEEWPSDLRVREMPA